MPATALFATALLAQAAMSMALDSPATEAADVGYAELTQGEPEAAIEKIESNNALEQDDPGALINLGNAYARLGHNDKAIQHYRAAIDSNERYDLELADGRWMDSRRAAREALSDLQKNMRQAMRR